MRWLFHRNLIMPALLVLGALAMIGGGFGTGCWFYGAGFVYWWIAGIVARRSRRVAPPVPAQTDVVCVAVGGSVTDGMTGALSRLDPRTQAWLRDELAARIPRD